MSPSSDPAERPQTVVWFELLSFPVLAGDAIFDPGLTWIDLIWVALMLWIIGSITRGRSGTARWIFTVFAALGFFFFGLALLTGMTGLSDISPAALLLTFAAVVQLWLLWSPATSRWIASRGQQAAGAERAA